jgi:predicted nuclease of restriction endonuclease-like (RecB) superfamily
MVMKQGKYHLIKKNGNLLKLADSIQIAGLFSEGLAPVYVKKQYNSLHQKIPTYFLEFIDSNGQIAMSHFVNDSIDYSEYIDIEAGFKDGKAIVKSRNELGWDYYFIDRKKRFSPLYSAAKQLGDSLFLGALGVYMSDIRIVDKDYWVMSQFQQKPLQVGQFNNGLLAFKNKEGYWGFINQSGKTVIAPKYTAINPFKNNVALVVLNGRFGFIDTKGKEYFIDR